MKNTFGTSLSVTLFGESHGNSIGAVLDGMPAGVAVDTDFLNRQTELRKPKGKISTKRHEADEVCIVSGVFEGKTTGTPICVVIKNGDTKSKDYEKTKNLLRPSHADYTAHIKYNGYEDYRGGGHFSGRITSPLVAVGAIVIDALKQKGVEIGTHIKKIADVSDRDFNDFDEDFKKIQNNPFAVLDSEKAKLMTELIETAAAEGDSIGGILQTAVTGLPTGVGEPWFDTVEGVLAHALFSVPAVKGVEFGRGFEFADLKGSEANDEWRINDGEISTVTNNNGGINGGITNGMPIVINTVIKPTPSIAKEQNTVDIEKKENSKLIINGRHDPCIVHRAAVVVSSVTAIALCDLLLQKYGTDWLVK